MSILDADKLGKLADDLDNYEALEGSPAVSFDTDELRQIAEKHRLMSRESIAALTKAHEWLERVDQRTTGYFGLDHKLGDNVDGCDFCHAVAMLEGRVEPLPEGSY